MKYAYLMFPVIFTAFIGVLPLPSLAEEAPPAQPAAQPEAQPAPAPAPAAWHPGGYMVLKAGVYVPSEKFDLESVKLGSAEHLNPKNGFDGSIALGYYFLPILAGEFEAGYFHSKATPTTGGATTKLDVVPVLLTAKLILPIGPLEPYAEGGGGAYITSLKGTGDLDNFKLTTKATYGLHAGAGVNLYILPTVFVGAEGRYIWSRPKFGGQPVDLNGFVVTGDLGFRF